MKTKLIIAAMIMMISSCYTPKYLPSSDQIDVNQYGSYIVITMSSTAMIKGELIAIDTNKIVVLNKSTRKCAAVSVKEVNGFSLRYASPKHYGGTIGLIFLLPFFHGAFSVLTVPLNLIVTIAVTASGESAFTYNQKNMTYAKLKMFARFPQGIPPGIDLGRLK